MVGLGVSQNERVESTDARLTETLQDRTARRARVHQHGGIPVLEKRRVALTHFEEGDDELVSQPRWWPCPLDHNCRQKGCTEQADRRCSTSDAHG